ncbi:acyltransferase family protein [Chryseobacterium sp. M5]|uniref:acyltransferase family protein n=1 Tax=Chryseobacterium sp. M5 TaxID=3379128 RepID=UPI0038573B64
MISRTNNLDFLRLIFASIVVVTHSYPLSGTAERDFLSNFTSSQIALSYIGVKGFFIISGYLIFKSLLRCENLFDFYWKRILRLFPALLIVLVLTVLFAPAVYENPVPYWQNKSVFTYIPHNLSLFFLQFKINGVFENNPYKGVINGSLWTIRYEFCMYIMASSLFFIRKKNILKTIVILIFILSYILSVFYPDFMNGPLLHIMSLSSVSLYDFTCFFSGGMLLTYINFKDRKFENIIIITSLILFIVSLYSNISLYTCFFTLPILVILIGKKSTKYINKIGNTLGDISYGIYIYSFPIQQALMYFFKLDLISLMVSSLLLSFIMGYISWHLIEKKALEYKNLVNNLQIKRQRLAK